MYLAQVGNARVLSIDSAERFWNKYTSNTSEQTQRHSRRTICAR
ncbi:hypothetical protein FAEUMB_24190 [Faecalimonas umbilicata]|uniref:Uncharacterized protein n=1 Tax=Faecalimonas umbilicata TaxID=1912855 RepID=A0ABQ0QZM9_9FIRM|nr:hypothetical protein FAEUMB_24190 [Faecalimonas umbilicata]